MDLLTAWLELAFMTRPWALLAWPAAAMVLGALLGVLGGGSVQVLGIIPRSLSGVFALFTAPFMHVNLAHLFANLPPFLVLGWLVLLRGEELFIQVSVGIALGSGLLVWLLGRKASHMGMSGVILGYLGFLLCAAWRSGSLADLGIAAVVLVFYGGMLGAVAPARDGSSWEAHLFGLLVCGGLVWVV
jgi:membrane associated rhomboid family serine protease